MAQPQAAQAPGAYLGMFGNQPIVPSSNTLISLKLLGETNQDAYRYLASEATKFLTGAVALYKADPVLRLKLSSDPIQGSTMLAEILRNQTEKKFFEQRIDTVSNVFRDKLLNNLNNDPDGIGNGRTGAFTARGNVVRIQPGPGAAVAAVGVNAGFGAVGANIPAGSLQLGNTIGLGSIFLQ